MFDPKETNIQANQTNSVKEADFPIHSMKQDLERLKKNPQYDPGSFSEEQIQKNESSIQSSLNDKQKTSPFLSENPPIQKKNIADEHKPVQIVKEAAIPKNVPVEQQPPLRAVPDMIKEAPKSSNSKASWMILPAILIVIGAGFGIYYYLNRPNQDEVTEEVGNEVAPISAESDLSQNNAPQSEQNPPVSAPDPKKIELFEDKPNFMVISEGNEVASLTSYVSEVKNMASGTLVEFVPTNSNYVPLKLSEFSQKFSISYPASVSEIVDDESLFSLYTFNESGNIRLGLVINLKSSQNSEQIFSSWEDAMIADLRGLYIDGAAQENDKIWNSGNRDGIKTRYKNLAPDGVLSLDYAIIKNKLVIATSKNFSWDLIDKLNQ